MFYTYYLYHTCFCFCFLTFKGILKQSSQYLLFNGQRHLRVWREAPIIFTIQSTHLFPTVAASLPFTPLYSPIWLPSFLVHIPQGFTEVLPQSQLSILTPPPHSQSTSFFHIQLRTHLFQKSPQTWFHPFIAPVFFLPLATPKAVFSVLDYFFIETVAFPLRLTENFHNQLPDQFPCSFYFPYFQFLSFHLRHVLSSPKRKKPRT